MPQVVERPAESLSLGEFVDWIQATDPHAGFHLNLVREADEMLRGEEPSGGESRLALSDRLERWRYQLLNHFSGHLAATDWDLADALDLAANDLAGREKRGPRRARSVLGLCPERPSHLSSAPEFETADPVASLTGTDNLDALMERARSVTDKHFSRTVDVSAADRLDQRSTGPAMPPLIVRQMKLYAPLYVSNLCINHCLYCGFRYPHQLQRIHLERDDALRQARYLWDWGFRSVLVVAGDYPQLTTAGYFADIISSLRERGFQVAIEIAPQSTLSYEELARVGATGLTLYQETYDETAYAEFHPRGSKASFDWRLEAHERAAEAGFHRLGLGVLLGLGEAPSDVLALIRHGNYLRERFPQCRLAFSLPRIFQAPEGFEPPHRVDDQTFVRLYCVLRLAFPDADLVLSTREPIALRNQLARICVTQMSAGSSTAPGGYERNPSVQHDRQQFPVVDQRTPAEVAQWLRDAGLEPVWDFV